MYETKAFWGKESNQNINTINSTMTFLSSSNVLYVVVIVVILALIIGLIMSTTMGFG